MLFIVWDIHGTSRNTCKTCLTVFNKVTSTNLLACKQFIRPTHACKVCHLINIHNNGWHFLVYWGVNEANNLGNGAINHIRSTWHHCSAIKNNNIFFEHFLRLKHVFVSLFFFGPLLLPGIIVFNSTEIEFFVISDIYY